MSAPAATPRHGHMPLTVWTLRHLEDGNTITVALPDGFIPDSDWEMTGPCVQTMNPSDESEGGF